MYKNATTSVFTKINMKSTRANTELAITLCLQEQEGEGAGKHWEGHCFEQVVVCLTFEHVYYLIHKTNLKVLLSIEQQLKRERWCLCFCYTSFLPNIEGLPAYAWTRATYGYWALETCLVQIQTCCKYKYTLDFQVLSVDKNSSILKTTYHMLKYTTLDILRKIYHSFCLFVFYLF